MGRSIPLLLKSSVDIQAGELCCCYSCVICALKEATIMECDGSVAAKISRLQERLSDLFQEDEKLRNPVYLSHWLQGSSMDVLSAEQAIRCSMKWRQEMDIDTLANKELAPDLLSKVPIFQVTSKSGRPVSYWQIGDLDMVRLLKEFDKEHLLQHLAQVFAKMEAAGLEFDNRFIGNIEDTTADLTSGCVAIYDLDGFSWRQALSVHTIHFCLDWAKMYINHFPTAGHTLYIINAKKYMEVLLKVIRPIVGGRGLNLKVFLKDDKEWEETLETIMDPNDLSELQAKAKRHRV